jgi:Flp pilus assembly protein TadG
MVANQRNERRGASVVELALCLPIVMTIIVGAAETSRLVYVQQILTVAAHVGARSVACGGSAADASATIEQIASQRQLRSVNVSISPSTASPGELITVTVSADRRANALFGVVPWLQGSVMVTVHVAREQT